MMRTAALVLSIGAVLSAPMAEPVSAQASEPQMRADEQRIGTRFKRKAEQANATESRQMQKDVARCVVYRNKDLSRELLAKSDTVSIDFYQIDDLTSDEMFRELDVADCLGRAAKGGTLSISMRIPLRTLRNLMTEEVYLLDQKEQLEIPAGAPDYLENRYYAAGRHPGAIAMARLSDCLTVNAPIAADSLLRSRPGSTDEEEAIEALFPALLTCAGEKIADTEIDTSAVRTVIADGMWARLHYGPTAPVAADEEITKDDDA